MSFNTTIDIADLNAEINLGFNPKLLAKSVNLNVYCKLITISIGGINHMIMMANSENKSLKTQLPLASSTLTK
jgi:hypothetical protein